jgi:hypothetical protein
MLRHQVSDGCRGHVLPQAALKSVASRHIFDNINSMPRTQRPVDELSIGIGRRIVSALQDDLGLSMKEAGQALGYANPSPLYSFRYGKALPDPARLAAFAREQAKGLGKVLNLHWVLTGHGAPFIEVKSTASEQRSALDIDIMNRASMLSEQQKKALLVLLSSLR